MLRFYCLHLAFGIGCAPPLHVVRPWHCAHMQRDVEIRSIYRYLYMYTCRCTSIPDDTPTHVRTYLGTCTYTCIRVYNTRTRVHVHTWKCSGMYIHTNSQAYLRAYICVDIYVYERTYMRICTYMRAYVHTCILRCVHKYMPYIRACMRTCLHTDMRRLIYSYIHRLMHACSYTFMHFHLPICL